MGLVMSVITRLLKVVLNIIIGMAFGGALTNASISGDTYSIRLAWAFGVVILVSLFVEWLQWRNEQRSE